MDWFKFFLRKSNKDFSDWQKITAGYWRRLGPPWRPSRGDLSCYEKYIKRFNPKRCLLLGSTPELRDLLAYLKTEVYLVDFSLSMIKQMTKLMKKNKIRSEKWIVEDWLKLDFKEEFFDVVVGDLVLRNVALGREEEFLRKIKLFLNSKGGFITRLHYLNEEILNKSCLAIIKEIIKEYLRGQLSKRETQGLIISRLFDICTDFKHHHVKRDEVISCLQRFRGKTKKEKEIVEELISLWEGSLTWTQRNKSEIINLFEKYFNNLEHCLAKDYLDSKLYPVFCLS